MKKTKLHGKFCSCKSCRFKQFKITNEHLDKDIKESKQSIMEDKELKEILGKMR